MNVFVVQVPFFYYVFRSITENLDNSFFIIPPMEDKLMSDKYGSGMSGIGLYDYSYRFLKEKGVNIIDYGEVTRNNFITFINKHVRNVICTHHFIWRYYVENTRIFQIVFSLPTNEVVGDYFDEQLDYDLNFMVDLVLTYGPESVDRFKERGLDAIAVGNPLFDYWYSDQIDELSLELIESKLVKDAPTILYLPTNNYQSSIDRFSDTIISLGRKYNVIVKLHHVTFGGEANRLCKFVSHPEIVTLGDFFDPLVLYKVADIILTDVSGALFDSLLAKKPVVMLGNSIVKYKVDILDPERAGNPVERAGIFPYTENPDDVEKLIKKALQQKVSVSKKLLYSLFYKRDGQAGKRAADAIINNKKYPLVLTTEKYNRAIERASDSKQRKTILELKNHFLRYNYPEQTKKPSLISRIYRHFLKN